MCRPRPIASADCTRRHRRRVLSSATAQPVGTFPVLPGSARMAAPSEVFTELLREREKSGLFVCKKVSDLTAALGEQAEDVCRRAVPQPGPDHLRRGPVKDAEPLKIFILGYDFEPVVTPL